MTAAAGGEDIEKLLAGAGRETILVCQILSVVYEQCAVGLLS